MAKFTGIKGNVIDTPTVIGQQIEGPPPESGDYTSIEGDVKKATTLTAQIFQPGSQPRTASSNSASAAPLGASSDSSSPSPGNISNGAASHALMESVPEGVKLEDLHNDDARELLRVVRNLKGKTLLLCEIEQIQIQYGVFRDIPWCILGFRLMKGKDAKDCVEVRVEGTVKSKGADIKGIWPPRKANDLAVFQTKYTAGRQFQIQLDSMAKVLTSLNLSSATEHTAETGQTLVPDFGPHRFEVILGVKKGSPSGTCVADLAEFFILVQLSKERIPVVLEVTANVAYRVTLLGKKVVHERELCIYSGEEKDDIRRGNVTTA